MFALFVALIIMITIYFYLLLCDMPIIFVLTLIICRHVQYYLPFSERGCIKKVPCISLINHYLIIVNPKWPNTGGKLQVQQCKINLLIYQLLSMQF